MLISTKNIFKEEHKMNKYQAPALALVDLEIVNIIATSVTPDETTTAAVTTKNNQTPLG